MTLWTAACQASCPSQYPRVCANSCPSSHWCYLTISSSVALFSCPQSFPASGSFPVSAPCIRWSKYWNFTFSISPSNEYSGLISFRIDWFDLLSVQGTLKSLLQHFESNNSSTLSHLYGSTLISVRDYWKNQSFDYTNLYWQLDGNSSHSDLKH